MYGVIGFIAFVALFPVMYALSLPLRGIFVVLGVLMDLEESIK